MFKVAILGCENSHADVFLDLVLNQKIVNDIEFVGVYSDDEQAAKKLNEKFGVYVATRYDEFVGKVDGIMITARHGDNHHRYAKPYLASGIPMFIDKPITVFEADGEEFMRALAKNGVRVCGGSSLIHSAYVKTLRETVASKQYGKILSGNLRAPVSMNNDYGGWFFYTQHQVQVMCELFGYFPKSVQAFQNGDQYNFVVRYPEYDVWATFSESNYTYSAGINFEKTFLGDLYTLDGCFQAEFMDFHRLLHGEAQPLPYREFFASVPILNAMYRSIRSKKEETVAPVGTIE